MEKRVKLTDITLGPNIRMELGDLSDLAGSIAGVGLQQPLRVVEQSDGHLILHSGFRRWQVLVEKGIQEVDVLILPPFTNEYDRLRSQAAENEGSRGLSPIEERNLVQAMSEAYTTIHGQPPTDQELARDLGWSAMKVADRKKLMGLVASLAHLVHTRKLSVEAAIVLSQLDQQSQVDAVTWAALGPTKGAAELKVQAIKSSQAVFRPAPPSSSAPTTPAVLSAIKPPPTPTPVEAEVGALLAELKAAGVDLKQFEAAAATVTPQEELTKSVSKIAADIEQRALSAVADAAASAASATKIAAESTAVGAIQKVAAEMESWHRNYGATSMINLRPVQRALQDIIGIAQKLLVGPDAITDMASSALQAIYMPSSVSEGEDLAEFA